ncbi:MAG: YbhB/YbcL family Raf kinase inhibitor-like protein [Turicibacter sanguinis]
MKVTSTGIIDGIIADEYGAKGTQFNENEMPLYSLPLKIEDAPQGTKSFAIVMEDKDAVPVCGFSWIHWLVANLTRDELLAGESQTATDFIQGVNSWISIQGDNQSIEASSYYGGMAPPNALIFMRHMFMH